MFGCCLPLREKVFMKRVLIIDASKGIGLETTRPPSGPFISRVFGQVLKLQSAFDGVKPR